MSALRFSKELREALSTCSQQGCSQKGRFYVLMAGYPVEVENRESLERRVLVCRSCRKEMEREWAEVLEVAA